jgi:hypothetical protein
MTSQREQWIELHRSAYVEIWHKGGWWLSWSPRLEHGPFRTRLDALLAAAHALGLRGVDADWRRLAGHRLAWSGKGDRRRSSMRRIPA